MAIKRLEENPTLADRNKGVFHRHNLAQQSRMVKGVEGEMYGLEMEVYSTKGQEAIVEVANEGCKKWFVDMEPDGSLDPNKGLEVITRGPIPPSLIFTKGGWLAKLLKRLVEDGGVQKGPQPRGYGLHVNVNCAGWTWLEKNAFCAAINYMPSVNKKAAGRDTGGSSFNSLLTWHPAAPYRPYMPRHRSANCYIRVSYNNPDCMEVRMFQMNSDVAVIRGYISHLREIREFSKKFQPVLLMCAAWTVVVSCNHRAWDYAFGDINDYLEDLWANREEITLDQAIVAFDKAPILSAEIIRNALTNQPAESNKEFVNEVFDKTKTFQRRYESLTRLWYSP